MELKLGVSKFWILVNLLLMVTSQRLTSKCRELQAKLIPDRCLHDGDQYPDDPNNADRPCSSDPGHLYNGNYCCFKNDPNSADDGYYSSYRFHVWHFAMPDVDYFPQNTLRYTDQTLAQEGRSFCLVGEHFYQTQLLHWKNFKMFRPLANRLFDIGNHIDPEDSRRMNTFTPFDTDTRFSGRRKGFRNVLTTKELREDFKEVYCGTKRHPFGVNTKGNGLGWEYWNCGLTTEFPYDTLADVNPNKYKNRPPIYGESMDPRCSNPYKVLVTRIDVDGKQMKNYLHIKIYSDLVTTPPAGRKCPTGRMKYVMLEVRDQDGFPVGQFTNDIPCDTVANHEPVSCPPSTAPCRPHYGNKKNFMPCMFSHRLASEAPMIFLAGVEGGSVGSGGNASGPGGGGAVPGGPPGPPGGGQATYFTEVHATWRFAQMSSHLITELHFATMIVEDEKPIRYYTSRITDWDGVRQCGLIPNRPGWWVQKYDGAKICCSIGATTCVDRAAGWKSSEHGTFTDHFSRYYYPTKPPYIKTVDANPFYHCGLAEFCSLNYHANGTNNTDRPYGFSAQYRMIKLKRKSLGGWDYFQGRFNRDSDVNCHKDIPDNDPYFELIQNYPKGRAFAKLPLRRKMFQDERYRDIDGPDQGELEDYMTPGRFARAPSGHLCNNHGKYIKNWAYIANNPQDTVRMALKDIWNDPAVVTTYYGDDIKVTEYFGTRYSKQSEATPSDVPEIWKEDLKYSVVEMVGQDNTRCPCPFVPTTEAPEFQTKAPVEVEARHLHVVNMLIAWIILVPLAFFVSRYYKETFSKVFFLQEFWWYTIHVLALLTALLFMIGSFYSMHLRREGSNYEILWTDATTLHIYFGKTLVGVFVIHLLLGPFRFWDVGLREIQIWLHWGVGWAEYILAAFTIISAAAIPQGLLNCLSFYIYIGFLVFQLIFYAVMENHIRQVDNKLDLEPPRRYFPVHSMRIFHKDAPGSYFRIVMLIAYFLISIAFYAAIHILTLRNPHSCFQKQKAGGAFSII